MAGSPAVFTADLQPPLVYAASDAQRTARALGPEQLIFGLDFPYNLEENTLKGIAAIDALGLSSAQRDMILGGNLRQVLKLS